jgi:tetratricopeptide (TPR) repeat protein
VKLCASAVCAASLSLSLLPAVAGAAVPPAAQPPAASYQFALGKLLAVEGSVNDALAAFEAAEKASPGSPDTAYVLVEHAQLLDRMAQYERSSPLRDDSLRKAGEKIAEARRLAPNIYYLSPTAPYIKQLDRLLGGGASSPAAGGP